MAQIPQATLDKAAAIQATLAGVEERVRSNPDLTSEARTRAIAQAYVSAEKEMAILKGDSDEASSTAERDLVRDAFGSVSSIGADAISARDADDRAVQLETSAEGLALLQRSESNGDAALSRAIALRAFNEVTSPLLSDQSWLEVLNAYLADRPEAARKMDALVTSRRSQPWLNASTMFAFVVSRPPEANMVGPVALESLRANA